MGRRLALLIATYEYQDAGLRRLTAPAHDAESLAAVLRDPAIAGFEVTTLVNEPHHRVGEAIGDFYRDRRRDDLALLYFSGHGLKDDDGRLYLAMSNTLRANLLFTALPADQVDQAMEGCPSRQKVLILDCCYSGAFPAGRLAKADTMVHALERFQGRGRTVLTASDATQYSFEGDQPHGQAVQSVFTRYLVAGLRDGSADLDGDGDITLDELYSYVHERVVEEMPQQRPKKQDNVEGRTVIARNINWTLPTHLRHASGSPIATDRLAALEGLAHLHRIGNDHVRDVVREEIRRLADDDSKLVSATAATLLQNARSQPPEPPSSPPGHSAGQVPRTGQGPQSAAGTPPGRPAVSRPAAVVGPAEPAGPAGDDSRPAQAAAAADLHAVPPAEAPASGVSAPGHVPGTLRPATGASPETGLLAAPANMSESERPAVQDSPPASTINVSTDAVPPPVNSGTSPATDAQAAQAGEAPVRRRYRRRTVLIAVGSAAAVALASSLSILILGKQPQYPAISPSVTLASPALNKAASVAFGPNGSLATAYGYGRADLWNTTTGHITAMLADSSSDGVDSVAFGPNGSLATGGYGYAELWNTATKRITATLTDPASHDLVSVAFGPDGTLATVNHSHVYLWNTATKRITATLTDPASHDLVSLAFGPDGTLAVQSPLRVYLWNTATKRITATLSQPDGDGAYSVAFGPDGTLATVNHSHVYLWSTTTKQIIATLADSTGHAFRPLSAQVPIAFGPSDTLAAADDNGHVYLWKITGHQH